MANNDTNHYPYAKTSRVLWKFGKYLIILLLLWYVVFNFILYYLSLGLKKLANSNGLHDIIELLNHIIGFVTSRQIPPAKGLGDSLFKWVNDNKSLDNLSIVIWILVIIAILYVGTIILRHHHREQAPFLNDMESKILKMKMRFALGAGWNNIYDEDEKRIRKVEKAVRRRIRRMRIHIHTKKHTGESVPTKQYIVSIRIPSNDEVINLLNRKIKNMPDRLRKQSNGVIFGDREEATDGKWYNFKGSKEAKDKEALLVKRDRRKAKKVKKEDKPVSVNGAGQEPAAIEYTFPLDLFIDRTDDIKKATKAAHDFAERKQREIANYLTSTEKSATHQLTEVGSSSVLYKYRVAFSKNQTSDKAAQSIEDGLSDALGVEGILVSGGASILTITLPLKEGEEEDGTLKYNYNIPIDVKNMIQKVDFKEPTDMILGMTPDNNVQHFPLAIAPHLLICGATGSGKSVNVQQMLITMMIHSTPDILKFLIVDPKRGDFSFYKGLPYMLADPITDMDDAMDAITYATIIMEERLKMFENVGVRDIKGYNKWAKENGKDILPFIVVTIDEYAQLMKKHKEVEEPIQEIAQMARAAGIHLIIGTQTPRANIITGAIRDNIDTRVAMKVANSSASWIALDDTGAEKLKKRGDMLIKRDDKTVRAQGAFISDDEIKNIFSHLRDKFDKPIYVDYKKVVARAKGEDDDELAESGKVPNSTTISTNANRMRPEPKQNSGQSIKGKTKVSTSASSMQKLKERARKRREAKEGISKTSNDSNQSTEKNQSKKKQMDMDFFLGRK
ncbi:MAG: FtsK/SpoIIIE domain-containing protein [Dermabacter sp.]|nr:FtsK/SpoIIIE domain-containing protein [Dermabacter sp.]